MSKQIKKKPKMVNCLLCDKKIQIIDSPDPGSCPNNATVWRTRGNYGSTRFDPMDLSFLEAYICDDCLVGKKKYFRRAIVRDTYKTVTLKVKDIFGNY